MRPTLITPIFDTVYPVLNRKLRVAHSNSSNLCKLHTYRGKPSFLGASMELDVKKFKEAAISMPRAATTAVEGALLVRSMNLR